MVAKYRMRKRHEDLIHALGAIADSHAFSVTFCGEVTGEHDRGFQTNLYGLAGRMGIADRVTFLDNVPHAKMAQIYRTHDLFVLPAINEPAAISPAEAAWCGCAVLVASDCGTRSYLPLSEEFEFVPGDRADLARSISAIIATPERLQDARHRCVSHIMQITSDKEIVRGFTTF